MFRRPGNEVAFHFSPVIQWSFHALRGEPVDKLSLR
jgi:hypothetical protein